MNTLMLYSNVIKFIKRGEWGTANPSSSKNSTNDIRIFSIWKTPCSGLLRFTARRLSSMTTSWSWKCPYSRRARLTLPALRKGSGNSETTKMRQRWGCTIIGSSLTNGFNVEKIESLFMLNILIALSQIICAPLDPVLILSSLSTKSFMC